MIIQDKYTGLFPILTMSRFFVSKYAQKKTRAREKSWQLYT